ncbi:hypothetical protein LOAG_07615 [Loa loa]|uniref:Uncharacterized protein n=1 Tax=Loa loa TaxID=7209 RepID=A0A1S0TV82_LOALO|nr:hypothetical protein LOAG_07615 [Loa loa]EFO20876.1 hypothetical protein LOAG_07615 [Loa loa]
MVIQSLLYKVNIVIQSLLYMVNIVIQSLLYSVNTMIQLVICNDNTLIYKILIYSPCVTTVNVNYLVCIGDELVKAGHNFVVYLPNVNPNVKTNGSKLAKLINEKPNLSPVTSIEHIFHNVSSMETYSFWEILKVN